MQQQQQQKLDRLISRTYACALGFAPWSGLAGELSLALDSPSAVLRRAGALGDEGVIACTENFRLDGLDPLEVQHWFENDLWAERAAGEGLGQIVHTQALIANHELHRSGFYQDWLRRLGIHHALGCVFEQPGLGPLVLGVHREVGASGFDTDNERLLRDWLPHLRQALTQAQPAGALSMLTSSSSSGGDDALLLLDPTGHPCWHNPVAQRLLERGDCLALQPRRRQLQLRGELAGATGWLQAQLSSLRHPAPPPLPSLWQHHHAPNSPPRLLLLHAMRLPQPPTTTADSKTPLLLLRLRRPLSRPLDLSLLGELFRLTPAEARVLDALCQGRSTEQIADLHQVQVNTVRAQIKQLLLKTGTRRQAELLALTLRAGLS